MIEKSRLTSLALATIAILGQSPSNTNWRHKKKHKNFPAAIFYLTAGNGEGENKIEVTYYEFTVSDLAV
jgi:hypothetical protein